MREIKFRAWDGDKKEMILPEYADRQDFHIQADGTIVETHEYGYERHELTSARPDSWVLMQYTGLKDKNGKEIYEGDIVTDFYGVNIVEWGSREAKFQLAIRNDGGVGLRLTHRPFPLDASYLKVIGNIYENPELLTP